MPDSAPVLVRGLRKRLGAVWAVAGLDLAVEQGRVLGLAGPNGAGKSVTLKILLGLVRPDAGRAELFGEPAGPGASVLSRVGALVDGPAFVPHLSGRQNLLVAAQMKKDRLAQSALEEAVEFAQLGPAIDRKYKTYSHGMRYRLGLAQATLGWPELLLLDEPTTALDPEHKAEVRRVIEHCCGRGITVLFSSHDLAEVERACTDVVVMHRGRAVLTGTVPELVATHGSLAAAYEGALGLGTGGTRPAGARPLEDRLG